MLRVYIAGPYSAPNVINVLNNMRNGMRESVKVFLAGMAPFTPWHDYHHQLMLRNGEELSVEQYYKYSLTWLEASNAVYVIGDYKSSKGTLAEIERANELGIPIFYTIDSLIEWKQMVEQYANF
jgi:hypothetical protein